LEAYNLYVFVVTLCRPCILYKLTCCRTTLSHVCVSQ